jgi:hypothetical protein
MKVSIHNYECTLTSAVFRNQVHGHKSTSCAYEYQEEPGQITGRPGQHLLSIVLDNKHDRRERANHDGDTGQNFNLIQMRAHHGLHPGDREGVQNQPQKH